MIPKKPAPDLIRGGNRFSEKIMLQCNIWTMIRFNLIGSWCSRQSKASSRKVEIGFRKRSCANKQSGPWSDSIETDHGL